MGDLKDYSGELRPGLELADFSPVTLARLAELYCRLFQALDGYWYLTVKERLGNREAFDCDLKVWEKICRYEMEKLTKTLNIRGNDIEALVKTLQVEPLYQQTRSQVELKSSRNAVFTVTYCPILEALEKEGQGREKEICSVVSAQVLRNYASFFSSDIVTTCLMVPPRKSKDDICCQWQFSLKD